MSDNEQAANRTDARATRRITDARRTIDAPRPATPRRSTVRPPTPRTDDETRAYPLAPPAVDKTRSWPVGSQPTARVSVRASTFGQGPATAAPRLRNRGRLALIALAALTAIGAAVVVGIRSYEPETDDTGGIATDTWHPKYAPQKDVELDHCKIDRAGAHVGGTVRNPTDDAADYVIEVHLVDATGATITSASPTAHAVPAGSETTWTGVLPPAPSTAQSATCKITKVNRYVAD